MSKQKRQNGREKDDNSLTAYKDIDHALLGEGPMSGERIKLNGTLMTRFPFPFDSIVSQAMSHVFKHDSSRYGDGNINNFSDYNTETKRDWSIEDVREGNEPNRKNHRRAIVIEALESGDINTLARLCVQAGGLAYIGPMDGKGEATEDDLLRSQVWCALINKEMYELVEQPSCNKDVDMAKIKNQCELDINRSMYSFSCCKAMSSKKRNASRVELLDLVMGVLSDNKSLHYYQGFDNVCTVFSHVFKGRPMHEIQSAIGKVSVQIFADHHRRNFDTTIRMMDLLMIILKKFDPDVFTLLQKSNVGTVFALPWIITGFSHSITDIRVTKRVYDAILATHPLLCIYLSVAMILRPFTRSRLFESAKIDDSMASIHYFLQTVAEPCMPLISSQKEMKKWSRKLKRNLKNTKKNLDSDVLSGGAHHPTSIEETEDNNVDFLIERAVAMMCLYTPEQVCSAYRCQMIRNPDNKVGYQPQELPDHSVSCISMNQKAHWMASLEFIKRSSHLYCQITKRVNPWDRQLKFMICWFGLTTALGVTIASTWYSNTNLQK